MDDPLIEEQKAYYRARAPEYDRWFTRTGRYDHGPEWKARWDAEVEEVAAALEAFAPAGEVLELAAGTGWWTERLARAGARVTAVDASAEALALNRERVAGRDVRHVQADVFAWTPDRRYDAVFFAFWLSHVPPERFAAFWALVRAALAPGGRVFFVDSLAPETERDADRHATPADPVAVRRLDDGREFRIVKVFYAPAELEERLAELGWEVQVRATPTHFLYGRGAPR